MQSSTMSPPSPTIYTSKEMYHQMLPHFVLRQFLFVPPSRLREKVQNRWRRYNAPSERIFVYDLVTGQLLQQPVPRVHRKLDVFNDLKDSTNVEYVESKLADLEHAAATIVRAIHYGLQAGAVTLSRARLSILRKFIFLTDYRGLAVHTQEAASPHGETKGPTSLLSRREAWLQGLKYYLDTAHHDIIATGERLKERYGNSRLSEMLRSQNYPDNEELALRYAIQYEDLANTYFLGVWIAAEESEFVLSGHAFSLWEGTIRGTPGAHRLHVLSPRIAIILRRTCLHDPRFNHPSVLYSSLAGVPISQPAVRYAKEDLIDLLEANPAEANSVMNFYRTTLEAEQDSFRYSFTRLSLEQTYAVNEVVMMHTNLRHHGSVIFRQPSAMRETLDLYMASPNTFLGGKQKLFRPLPVQLVVQDDSQRGQVGSSSLPQGESESTTDCQLSLLLGFMIQNYITFPSIYTRAFVIFHMATAASSSNPIALKMRNIHDAVIDKLRCLLDPPLPEATQESSCTAVVQSLANEESELFFSLVGRLLDQANAGIRRSNDFFATVINEAAIIGVTYWLAEERPDVLKDIFLPWVHVLA